MKIFKGKKLKGLKYKGLFDELSQIKAAGRKDRVDPITFFSFEWVALKTVFTLHMPNHRLNGRSAVPPESSPLAFDFHCVP